MYCISKTDCATPSLCIQNVPTVTQQEITDEDIQTLILAVLVGKYQPMMCIMSSVSPPSFLPCGTCKL